MEFNEFKKQCGYRSSQNDDNGEEVLNFCHHKRNPDKLEGNCNIDNCKEAKVYGCKCDIFNRAKYCKVHANP